MADKYKASLPEPSPRNAGREVTPILLDHINRLGQEGELSLHQVEELCSLVKERDAYGRVKYGQPLMTEDGRDDIEDARQEIGDFIQYVVKASANGKDLSAISSLLASTTIVFDSLLRSGE